MAYFDNIWNPKKIVLVSIQNETNGIQVFGSIIKKNKVKDSRNFQTIEDLIKHYGKEKPYVIHVHGSGILTRKVENIPNFKEQLIVNGDKDEFYFSTLEFGGELITSFFRKSIIESIIEVFDLNKAFLIQIIAGLIPALSMSNSTLEVNLDYSISIENNKVKKFEKNNGSNLSIDGQFGTYHELIALSFSDFFYDCLKLNKMDFTLQDRFENFKNYSKFKFFGLGLVSFLLISLIANYLYLNFLNNQVADKEIELSLKNENYSVLQRLEQEKTRKEQLILSSGINSKSFISFYLNAIAKSVPNTIKLSELHSFPLHEALKQKRKVSINQQQIEILGITPSNEVLDDWMEKMNRFEWVNRVELMNYSNISDKAATFKLIIVLG